MKRVGPVKAALLAKLGIFTIGDLLEHYPRRYEDRSQLKTINCLGDGQTETFRAKVTQLEETKPRRGLTITKLWVRDETGKAQIVWFNQPYVKKWYKPGMELIVSGKIQRRYYQIEVSCPEIEIIDGSDMLHTGCIVPIYPASENINQRFLRTVIRQALDSCHNIVETLPQEVIEQFTLLDRAAALENIHFPLKINLLNQARRRLVFEELYLLQCGLLYAKHKNKANHIGIKLAPDGQLVHQAEQNLPFMLTGDQQQVLREIKADMEDVSAMQRLVQGDVGSGKTVVAAIALIKAVENGYQGAMMAPTEILAEQHYRTLEKLFAPLAINLAILTGKISRRNRDEVLKKIGDGSVDVVVGTHALIQDAVEFKHLGLVVTDEQHRFGVGQRARLQAKGNTPDMLVMTATPIPRTMALTVYGDLDISVIRQLPPGRKVVKTYTRGSEKRNAIYDFVVKEVQKGRQAYVVCPLVEESDKIEAQSATTVYEQLIATHFQYIPCGLVYGKLKQQDKNAVMNKFYCGETKVLIATTVIEVGVNVPNATVMVIEGADRFGLAQLHQLRGRIGRGEHQSYCILLSDSKNTETLERLAIMTKTNDGFLLAEEDLKLRGPGQFFGFRQHGMPDLKIADIVKDTDILIEARHAAQQTVVIPERFSSIRSALIDRFGEQFTTIFQN
jgi:ATP-dependent DNA helicase RecG